MKIDVPFTKLKEIYHAADVHIRLFKRHDEYRETLNKFYTQIKKSYTGAGVILVAGDILHAKTDMSPEMVDLASEFLKSLAAIAPTIVIAGNHDLNLSNVSRMDSLTPIISNIGSKNLHYFKHSGVYQVADVDFAVFSILDEREDWPVAADCRKNARKIALFHGPVHGALTDAKFVITNRHVENSTFDGFDMVLLGDIHKYQVLQKRDEKARKPVIVYSSSLIQQNHGETVNGHGWCLWNVEDCTHQFIELPNDYGYYTFELKNGTLLFPTDIPKNVRLRLFTGIADNTTVKKTVSTLRKRYNVIELSINKNRFNAAPMVKGKKASQTNLDVTNLNTQNTFIQDWIERNHDTVDEDLMKKIVDVNTKIHAQVVHDDHSRNIHWKPLHFTFSNMFSYGEDNEINFASMNGIHGIFAQNASGKSSSMDALIFCLYDKTPRAFKGDHIMNNRRDTFKCELKLEIDNQIYFIKRTGTRKKNGDVKVDVSFWKENPDGTHLSINGEDRRDTNALIRSYVGSYEDFILTTLSSQSANALFIDKSHSERKDLLIQFMGLNIFDKMFDVANEESKELSGALRKFQNIDFTQTLADTQTNLEYKKSKHATIENSIADYKDERDGLDAALKDWQEQKRAMPNIELDMVKLQRSLSDATELSVRFTKDKFVLETKLSDIHTRIQKNLAELSTVNLDELKHDAESVRDLTWSISNKTTELNSLKEKLNEREHRRIKLEGYTFNADCPVCVDNNKTVIADLHNNTEELTRLGDDVGTMLLELEAMENRLHPMVERKKLYDKYSVMQADVNGLKKLETTTELEIQKLITSIEKCDRAIAKLNEDITLHDINEENIKHNDAILERIAHVEYYISVNKKVLDKLERELREVHGEIKVLEATKANIMKQLKEAEELEDVFEAYKYYLEAVGRDGVPYDIMSKAIPTIESEINNILTQIVDFTISLEVDTKNIVGKLNYDHERIWPLENSSGMERFISSLAIRVALLNASNLPKSSFMIIDEGLGTLDAENLSSMGTLFNILKSQFDFLVIISHLDSARDMVDKVIEIRREDGFSYINV